ncbi:MAG: S41 family peptidase [Verrucomicrobiota bacterium]|nr:S41 family peptidase [Verrucomicrobiota bacterium]
MKLLLAPALTVLLFAAAPTLRAQGVQPKPDTSVPERKPGAAAGETPAAPKPPNLREIVDSLTEADVAEFLKLLREHYVSPAAFGEKELARATILGVLERIAPGATIVAAPTVAEATRSSPFRSEILEDRIGYVRLGSLTPEHVLELDASLQLFGSKSLQAVVLDLRATPRGSHFERAAEVCRRFCPKGRVLFTVRKPSARHEAILTSKEDPKWTGLLVALVDTDTAGAAEVIAAVLRAHTKAMVIGQRTRGEAVEYADVPLPGGKILRVAVAEVALPENVSIFPAGVKPDLLVEVPAETTEELLKRGLESGVAGLIAETERARMNEAALVAGINPELEALQELQRRKGERPKPPLRDAVLQRAIDFVTTVALYERKPRAVR